MLGCDHLFYYPSTARYDSPERCGVRYESVSIPTPDELRLHGWFFPAQGESAGTVLHLHGNAGNITGHFHHVMWLPSAGWNVLCWDYRGYGESEGRISREGSIIDANAALDYLLRRPDVDANRVVAFGQSLGGAIGIVLTAERPEIKALAVDGAFDSYRGIVGWHIRRSLILSLFGWWVPRFAMRDGFDPIDCVGRIAPRPILIMHGSADQVVDPAMARRLYDAAGEPKQLWLVPGADHYGAMEDHAEAAHARLLSLFREALDNRAGASLDGP